MLFPSARPYLVASLVAAAALLPAHAQKKGGTLTYTYHPEPTTMSTISTTAVPVSLIASKIYESLLEYEGAGMKPVPGLAESWTVSKDQKTYTFKLRKGVTWHDGKPFTSADVKFSVEKVVTPYHSRGRTYFGEVEAIETPDASTVAFKLKQPVPYFIRAFQPSESPMMPRHGFTDEEVATGKIRTAKIMQSPIGTGAATPGRDEPDRSDRRRRRLPPGRERGGRPCARLVRREAPGRGSASRDRRGGQHLWRRRACRPRRAARPHRLALGQPALGRRVRRRLRRAGEPRGGARGAPANSGRREARAQPRGGELDQRGRRALLAEHARQRRTCGPRDDGVRPIAHRRPARRDLRSGAARF